MYDATVLSEDVLSFCLVGSRRSAPVVITDLCLCIPACMYLAHSTTAIPPSFCRYRALWVGPHSITDIFMARQNRQLDLKGGMHPTTRIKWAPFYSRTIGLNSVLLHRCTNLHTNLLDWNTPPPLPSPH